jgi:hypothetical protein
VTENDRRPAREWPIPPMDHEPGLKGTAFTWPMGVLILQRIADGDTIKQITADPRMPAYCTVFRWMKVVPEFGDYVRHIRALMAINRIRVRDAARARKGTRRRGGRPSTYSEAMAEWLLEELRQGASLSDVVAHPGAPSFKAIYRWLRNRPDFRAAYIEACDYRAGWLNFLAELAHEDVRTLGIAGVEARIAALQGRIGRLTPRTYRRLKQTPGVIHRRQER